MSSVPRARRRPPAKAGWDWINRLATDWLISWRFRADSAPATRESSGISNLQPGSLNSHQPDLSRLGGGSNRGFDQFPEFRILLQCLVFFQLEPSAEIKILQRVPTENAMNDHAKVVALEINPVIPDAETVQAADRALQFAELIQFGVHDLLGQAAELAQDLELEFLGHAGQLGGAGGIENDLECVHELVARTGIAPVFQP